MIYGYIVMIVQTRLVMLWAGICCSRKKEEWRGDELGVLSVLDLEMLIVRIANNLGNDGL